MSDSATLATWVGAIATAIAAAIAVFTLLRMRRDSIDRSRPYVAAELVPGLWGPGNWDLRIWNAGQSAARHLTITVDHWPEREDLVVRSLRALIAEPRILAPGAVFRTMWKLDKVPDTTPDSVLKKGDVGMDGTFRLTLQYWDNEGRKKKAFVDTYVVDIARLAPVSPSTPKGPEATNDRDVARQLKRIQMVLGEIVHGLGEMRR